MKRLFVSLVLACLYLPAAAAAGETARAPADANVNKAGEAAPAPAGISGKNATESTSSYTLGDLSVKYNGSGMSGSKAKGNEYGQMSEGPVPSGVFEWADGPYSARFSGEFTGDSAAHNDGYQSKWYDFQGRFEKSDHYRLTGYANVAEMWSGIKQSCHENRQGINHCSATSRWLFARPDLRADARNHGWTRPCIGR